MRRHAKLTLGGVIAAAVVGVGAFFGIAAATGDGEQALTGKTRERAVTAALAHVGGGTVTETETGDGGSAYEVEVRRPDGSQVEVHLDRDFRVAGSAADDDGPNDNDSGAGDRD
jgi:hypothetical protein